MMVNTNYLVPMTEANQNFSKVVRTVDESGMAVILKNNKPRYVVVDFDEYDTIAAAMQMRKTKIVATIGPASEDASIFEQLCLAGINVARLNFSHGSHSEHLKLVKGDSIVITAQLQTEKRETPTLLKLKTYKLYVTIYRFPCSNS